MIPQASSSSSGIDVSVIIVNYNGQRFLQACLDGLPSAFRQYSFETIVIDNASTDGSQDYLRTRSDIHYIESAQNLGFTGGNNRAALDARGRVLLLLNNDTHLQTPLDPLITQALRETVGAVGPRLVYGDQRLQLSVGFHHRPLRIVLSWAGLGNLPRLPSIFRRMQTDPAFYARSHAQVDWVSGAVLATRTSVWQKLQGLDDNFFMYCEDVDYCLRVRKLGLDVAYMSDVQVTHYEGAGKAWIGALALSRTCRSYFQFVCKHFNTAAARWMAAALSVVFTGRALAFAALGLGLPADTPRRAVCQDKGKGYWAAAKQLWSSACHGKYS
jgi:GT2 family glycosyltransferase